MKKLILLLVLIAVLMPAGIKAQDPDTIWTTVPNFATWFTPDGTRLITANGECYDVTDGHLIWEHGGDAIGIFSADSIHYYNAVFQTCRISDGKWIDNGVHPEFKEIPDFFETGENWTDAYRNGDVIMGEDENTFYCIYQQEYKLSMYPDSTLYTRILICKYKRDLDSIVSYTPYVINDTVEPNFDPELQLIGYSKATNTIIAYYNRRQGSWDRQRVPTFRQISGTTLDSVNEFIYDVNYGNIWDKKFSYSGEYFALGTFGGWALIYELSNFTLYNKFLERPLDEDGSVERMTFSRNDSFIVTVGGNPALIKTWNYHTGKLLYTYGVDGVAVQNLNVSPDNTMIIAPSLVRTMLLHARWTAPTAVEDNGDEKTLYLYPNPAGDYIDVILKERQRLKTAEGSGVANPNLSVKVYDVRGNVVLTHHLSPSREGESVRLDVSGLAAGVYFVNIGGKMYKFVKM
jgi:WD40 repeat protein